ncbi:hypothetical protein GOODEAATRI_024021 [Goodea atripinnis]|uniref:Uncharacterized protein n=1 Tax=Goodea atripinnis TaxID=208336 RepID=A0ABV0PGR3_9TELE
MHFTWEVVGTPVLLLTEMLFVCVSAKWETPSLFRLKRIHFSLLSALSSICLVLSLPDVIHTHTTHPPPHTHIHTHTHTHPNTHTPTLYVTSVRFYMEYYSVCALAQTFADTLMPCEQTLMEFPCGDLSNQFTLLSDLSLYRCFDDCFKKIDFEFF